MNSLQLLVLAFITTVLTSLIIGAWGRWGKKQTLIGFFWGDNSFSVSQATHLNLSTSFSINGIIYSAWLGYVAGWVSVIPQIVWCASFIWLSRYSKRISLLSKTGTLHGNIGYIFGKNAAYWASAASLIGFTLLLGWELYVGAQLFNSVTKINSPQIENTVYFSLAGIGALYCMVGGLRGNMYANEFQNYLSAVAVIIAIMYLGFYAPGTQKFSWNDFTDSSTFSALAKELTTAGIISNIVLFLVYQFLDMSNWQNIASLSAKTTGTKKSLWLSAFWVLVFPGITGSALGMVMRSFSNITSDNIVPELLDQLKNNLVIFTLLSAGFFAMMLSTIDGFLLAAAQAATWDIFDRKSVLKILLNRSSPQFSEHDIIHSNLLGADLKDVKNPLSVYLWDRLSEQSRSILNLPTEENDAVKLKPLVEDLNSIISNEQIYNSDRFSKTKLSTEVSSLIDNPTESKNITLLNRWLLEDAFPNYLMYNQHSHIMRKEKVLNDPKWVNDSTTIEEKEAAVLNHTKLAIFAIAIIGGIATLILVRKFGKDSFNLLYIAYVAQMALFPSIWAILHGEKKNHPRGAMAIALGLITGLTSAYLGLRIIPGLTTWAPVIAFAVACALHWPFRKYKNY